MTSPFPAGAFDFSAAAQDPLAFLRSLWGGFQVPGMSRPATFDAHTSLDELDKQIHDLKAVEGWLNLNLSLLRGSIQTLEMQRLAVQGMQQFGQSMAQAARAASTPAPASPPPAPKPAPAPSAASVQAETGEVPAAQEAGGEFNPAAWWNLMQEPFLAIVKQAVQAAPEATGPAPAPAPKRTRTRKASPAAPSRPSRSAAPATRNKRSTRS